MIRIISGLVAAVLLSVAEPATAAAQKKPEPVRILVGRFSDATPIPSAEKEQKKKETAATDSHQLTGIEYSGRKISIQMENADLRKVLSLFIELLNLKGGLAADVHGAISVRFINMPGDLALAMIFEKAGLEYGGRPEGRIIQRGSGYAGSLDGVIRVKGEKPATRDEIMKRYQGTLSVDTYQVTWLGKAVHESFVADLMNIAGYDVLSSAHYGTQMAKAASVEQRESYPLNECDQVLGGSYRTEGDEVSLNIELTSAASGAVLFKKAWSGRNGDLQGVLSQNVLELAIASKVTLNNDERRRVLAGKTASKEAWRLNADYSRIADYRIADFDYYKDEAELQADSEVEKALLEAVHLDPQYAEAWKNLGWVYVEKGHRAKGKLAERTLIAKENNEKAIEVFEKALKIKPDLIEALIGMGTALTGTDDDKALWYYRKSAELNPSFHESNFFLFKHLTKLKKDDEAAEVAFFLMKDKGGRDGRDIMDSLSKMQSTKAVLVITEALLHSRPVVRERAAAGIRKMKKKSLWHSHEADANLWQKSFQASVPALIRLLSDPAPQVRGQAAAALGMLGDTAAVKPLLRASTDADAPVRRESVGALGDFAGVSVAPDIMKFLKDPDHGVRVKAAEALGKIADKSAVPSLLSALKDPSDEVRIAALLSLGKIGDRTALPALQEALQDKDEAVREAAAEALGIMKNGERAN